MWADIKFVMIWLTVAGVIASLVRFYFKLFRGRITFMRKSNSDEI